MLILDGGASSGWRRTRVEVISKKIYLNEAAVEKFDTQELTGQKHCQSLKEAKSWRTLLILGGLLNDTNLNEIQGK